MNRYTRLGVIFLFIIQILCACTSRQVEDYKQDENIETNLQDTVVRTAYTGYIYKEMELSPYEPVEGAYLGAHVLANPEIEFDIMQFERAIDKDVAMTLRHYQMGDPLPKEWLLRCLAQKKVPYMVITPESAQLPYKEDVLEEVAKSFEDTYGIPMFVEFYPNPKDFGDPAQYISYFQIAKEIFKKHAPNVAFVWGVDMEDAYDSMIYYPGDDYVDWVGISMYFPIYKENQKYQVNIHDKLSYFYDLYQDKKPIIISKLAVSHYSNYDHRFYVNEAEEIINQIYAQLPTRYPRIKAVNYIDIDNIKMAPDNKGQDNFRISTEPKITKIYQEAIKSQYYLQNIEETADVTTKQWVKMRLPIYQWNNGLYLLEETIKYDWGIEDTQKLETCKVVIGGSQYYSLDKLMKKLNGKYNLSKDIVKIEI